MTSSQGPSVKCINIYPREIQSDSLSDGQSCNLDSHTLVRIWISGCEDRWKWRRVENWTMKKQSDTSQVWNFLASFQRLFQKFGCLLFLWFYLASWCTSLFCATFKLSLVVSLIISVNFSFNIYNIFCMYLFQYLLFNAKFLFTVLLDCSANPSYLQKQQFQLFIPSGCCNGLVFFKGVGGGGRELVCFQFGFFPPLF